MRTRTLVGALLTVMLLSVGATTSGDAGPAAHQSAVVWLKAPTLIVSTIVQGPVVFTHDDEKMARGEPCTTVYLWEAGKTRGEEVVSFQCVPVGRKAAAKFTVRTRPNEELGFGCILTEFQFAGETEGHGVPSPPRFTE
jgi:hypothetical protein